jgi:hypothetical protein
MQQCDEIAVAEAPGRSNGPRPNVGPCCFVWGSVAISMLASDFAQLIVQQYGGKYPVRNLYRGHDRTIERDLDVA